MNQRQKITAHAMAGAILWLLAASAFAQIAPAERVFPQSKAAVEKVLKTMQAGLSGHLPVLDGFAQPGERPLERYHRGFYQASVQVSTISGGSLVHITAKVTAWYDDPAGSQSGYQSLPSNGRIESDLMDQLAQQLASVPADGSATSVASAIKADDSPRSAPPPSQPVSPAVSQSAPAPRPTAQTPPPVQSATSSQPAAREPAAAPSVSRDLRAEMSPSLSQGLASREEHAPSAAEMHVERTDAALQAEADSLEEILKNQAHPKNLVAVKKSGTPVLSTPSLSAKPQFLASMHDEFEMLDFNRDWVHIRISGLSRGWIWRNSVEMPEGIADNAEQPAPALAAAADLFHVVRDENSQFPGDWPPLRGKNVKILSVQKVDENAHQASAKERLEYAKFLLDKNLAALGQKPELAGIVLIFDSVDGGMIAATGATLLQWKAGKLSDSALWHACFFDPPETFDSAGPAASQ